MRWLERAFDRAERLGLDGVKVDGVSQPGGGLGDGLLNVVAGTVEAAVH